jgi:hypothetical protein
MSWLTDLFAGGTEGVFKGVRDVVQTFKADPLEMAKLDVALRQSEANLQIAFAQGQAEVNKIEAASQDKFASRWRPAVGWICVFGLGYATLFFPLSTWVALNLHALPPPQLDTTILVPLVTSLLGLAGLRSYEKSR